MVLDLPLWDVRQSTSEPNKSTSKQSKMIGISRPASLIIWSISLKCLYLHPKFQLSQAHLPTPSSFQSVTTHSWHYSTISFSDMCLTYRTI